MTDQGTRSRREHGLMATCPACGRPVSKRAKQCPHCGDPLTDTPTTIEATGKRYKAMILIAGLACAVMAIVAILAAMRYNLVLAEWAGAGALFSGLAYTTARILAWWHHG